MSCIPSQPIPRNRNNSDLAEPIKRTPEQLVLAPCIEPLNEYSPNIEKIGKSL